MRNGHCGLRIADCGDCGLQSRTAAYSNPHPSIIRNPQSAIHSHSAIRTPHSAINPHSAIRNPQFRHHPVTAPNDADDTSRAYFASTPVG